MSEYNLVAEESVWYRSSYSCRERDDAESGVSMNMEHGEVMDSVAAEKSYFWIESLDRDDILAVPDFMTGEEALTMLTKEDTSFEEIVEDHDGCEIVEDKQEVFKSFP